MINQSFIHIIYSKQDYENLLEFINNKESRNKYDILGGAIILGELKLDKKIAPPNISYLFRDSLLLINSSRFS
jgi:hypothetical protein